MKNIFLFIVLTFSLPPFFAVQSLQALNCLEFFEQKEKAPLSKSEFELSLASKFQLLKVRMDMISDLHSRLSYLAQLVKDGKEKKTLDKAETKQLVEEAGLSIPKEKEIIALQGYVNNPYVGKKAKQLLNLHKKNKSFELEEEYAKLFQEIEADIKVAESMGISVDQYKADLSTYMFNLVMVQLWVGILTGNK